jgi:heme-degrading monooxygenase HmoA
MYTIMRKITAKPGLIGELADITAKGFLPFLKNEPGFLEFYCVQTGENEAVSISIFATREEAEEGNKKAFEWARERLFPLAQGPAEVVGTGEILLHQK